MKVSAKGRLVVCTEDSDQVLELSLDKGFELLDSTHGLVYCFQVVDEMHLGEVVQKVEGPLVAIVAPVELLQVKMDVCNLMLGTSRGVTQRQSS
jgi:hypothetical protein